MQDDDTHVKSAYHTQLLHDLSGASTRNFLMAFYYMCVFEKTYADYCISLRNLNVLKIYKQNQRTKSRA